MLARQRALTARTLPSVERGQDFRDVRQTAGVDFAVSHHGGQSAAVEMPSHHDHRFWRAGQRVGQVSDPQIALGCKPPVEFDLARTRKLTAGGRAEVQKVRGDRLFDFVGPITNENHNAGMGFAYLRIRR